MLKMKNRKNTLWCFTLRRHKSEISPICFVCCFLTKSKITLSIFMVSAEILKDVLRSVSSKVFTLFSSHFMWVPVKCNYSASVNQYLSFSDTIKIIMTKLT